MRTWILLVVAMLVTLNAQAGLPVQHWTLANGAQVYFIESHDLPMLDVSVDFAAGSAYDPADKLGLASLTHRMLDQGAGNLTDNQIASNLADVGAQLGGRLDADRAGVTLRTLSRTEERQAALAMLTQVLNAPTFAANIVEREKARVIAALRASEAEPASLAARAFAQVVFAGHPYGNRESGEIPTVSKLTAADLHEFYQTHYNANHAVIAMIGDITKTQADGIAQQLTASLPAASLAANTDIPAVMSLAKAVSRTIPYPAKQSQILIGQPGVARGDPDYYALYVGNYILGGGGFDSRLMEEVRQKRGLAYSVYSYFMPMKQAGAFQIGLQTKAEQTDQALAVVRDTLDTFISGGVTDAELTQAKNNIIGGFPLRIDSNKELLEYIAMMGYYQLPLTYLDDFPKHVADVTVDQIKSAFSRRINVSKLATVVVGGVVIK
ncbi:M16 family metallopeptidase [Sulfuriferula nivalis]|uniref:Peptidase M16 n=1 Tax=Sulfuriferula nivalis TaxID=2675298 RepID=A0A809SIM8_9PROT|nr:pitrilysin family protein [Sulfuriferula nivalis]BBP02160.1 peptidase M16 [Sulfuriferula nivalis]